MTAVGGATGLLPAQLWPLHGGGGRHQPDVWQGQRHVLWTSPPAVRARWQVYTAADGEYFMLYDSLPSQSEQDDKCTQQQMVSTSCSLTHFPDSQSKMTSVHSCRWWVLHVLWLTSLTVRARWQVYTAADGEYFMFSDSLPWQSEQDDKCTQQQMVSTSWFLTHFPDSQSKMTSVHSNRWWVLHGFWLTSLTVRARWLVYTAADGEYFMVSDSLPWQSEQDDKCTQQQMVSTSWFLTHFPDSQSKMTSVHSSRWWVLHGFWLTSLTVRARWQVYTATDGEYFMVSDSLPSQSEQDDKCTQQQMVSTSWFLTHFPHSQSKMTSVHSSRWLVLHGFWLTSLTVRARWQVYTAADGEYFMVSDSLPSQSEQDDKCTQQQMVSTSWFLTHFPHSQSKMTSVHSNRWWVLHGYWLTSLTVRATWQVYTAADGEYFMVSDSLPSQSEQDDKCTQQQMVSTSCFLTHFPHSQSKMTSVHSSRWWVLHGFWLTSLTVRARWQVYTATDGEYFMVSDSLPPQSEQDDKCTQQQMVSTSWFLTHFPHSQSKMTSVHSSRWWVLHGFWLTSLTVRARWQVYTAADGEYFMVSDSLPSQSEQDDKCTQQQMVSTSWFLTHFPHSQSKMTSVHSNRWWVLHGYWLTSLTVRATWQVYTAADGEYFMVSDSLPSQSEQDDKCTQQQMVSTSCFLTHFPHSQNKMTSVHSSRWWVLHVFWLTSLTVRARWQVYTATDGEYFMVTDSLPSQSEQHDKCTQQQMVSTSWFLTHFPHSQNKMTSVHSNRWWVLHGFWLTSPTVRARWQVYTATDGEYFMVSDSLPPQSEQDDKCTQQQMVSTSWFLTHFPHSQSKMTSVHSNRWWVLHGFWLTSPTVRARWQVYTATDGEYFMVSDSLPSQSEQDDKCTQQQMVSTSWFLTHFPHSQSKMTSVHSNRWWVLHGFWLTSLTVRTRWQVYTAADGEYFMVSDSLPWQSEQDDKCTQQQMVSTSWFLTHFPHSQSKMTSVHSNRWWVLHVIIYVIS